MQGGLSSRATRGSPIGTTNLFGKLQPLSELLYFATEQSENFETQLRIVLKAVQEHVTCNENNSRFVDNLSCKAVRLPRHRGR
jgi:hypothetical protein